MSALKTFVLILLSGIGFGSITIASPKPSLCMTQAPSINPKLLHTFKGADELLKTLYCLEKNEANRRAFTVWMRMVGLDHYDEYATLISETPGLKQYIFQQIKARPGLEDKLYSFRLYLDPLEDRMAPGMYFSVLDEAGRGAFSNTTAGSMWKYLLTLNNGNAEEALLMLASTHVGFHNDFAVKMYGDESQKMPFDVTVASTMLPKVIDPQLDIPLELKKKINGLETAHGHKSPEAKAYHANLAAFMSCEMLKTGADPKLVERLQRLTAFGYRLSILRAHYYRIKELMDRHEPLSEEDQISMDAYNIITANEHLPTPSATLSFFLNPGLEPTLEFRDALLHLTHAWGWPTERAIHANARLQEWALGKTWTIEQHKAGFAFAKRVCTETAAITHP